MECLRRESEAQVTAFMASVVNTGQAQRPKAQAGRDEKNLQDEVFSKVVNLSSQYISLL